MTLLIPIMQGITIVMSRYHMQFYNLSLCL